MHRLSAEFIPISLRTGMMAAASLFSHPVHGLPSTMTLPLLTNAARSIRWVRVSFVTLGFLCGLPLLHLQAQSPLVKPEDLGLVVPIGPQPEIPAEPRHVLVPVSDESTDLVVAKVYLTIGNRLIVKLPNGRLRSLLTREATETDRPFEPTKKELESQLREQFPGFKTRKTRRYLCIYNTTDAFCERTTTILETMYPMLEKYFQRQRFDVRKLDTPLVIVMFRTKAEFQRYRRMPEGLRAYYNSVNNRVFLYQYSESTKNAPVIAAKQATSTIAHEGVHQILHNLGVQKRLSDWPLWISEGLAEYFSPTTTDARSKWKGVGKPNDLRMRELFEYLKQQPGVGRGKLLEHVVTAERLSSAEYALAWSLAHYLATKRRRDFFPYLREVSELGPLEDTGDERARFAKHFGDSFARLERDVIKHIRSLPYADPVLNQPYHLITLISGTRRFATITSSADINTVKRSMLLKMAPQERARARFGMRTFPNRQQAERAMTLFSRAR